MPLALVRVIASTARPSGRLPKSMRRASLAWALTGRADMIASPAANHVFMRSSPTDRVRVGRAWLTPVGAVNTPTRNRRASPHACRSERIDARKRGGDAAGGDQRLG